MSDPISVHALQGLEAAQSCLADEEEESLLWRSGGGLATQCCHLPALPMTSQAPSLGVGVVTVEGQAGFI